MPDGIAVIIWRMVMNKLLELDKKRYVGKMPKFQKLYRKTQAAKFYLVKMFYKILFKMAKNRNHIELSDKTLIGAGLYIGHPYGITINEKAIIGENANIHKGVTIGQENRGIRKGTPIIGNNVCIGINATIVGAIHIGDDVLIAPNSYVNCDVPEHSVVIGNPCVIKPCDNATKDYINNTI